MEILTILGHSVSMMVVAQTGSKISSVVYLYISPTELTYAINWFNLHYGNIIDNRSSCKKNAIANM